MSEFKREKIKNEVILRLIDEGLIAMKDGAMPASTATSLLKRNWKELSDSGKFFLARTGLGAILASHHHKVRDGSRSYPAPPKKSAKEIKERAKLVEMATRQNDEEFAKKLTEELDDFAVMRLGRRLKSADGRQKPLYDFTERDLLMFGGEAVDQSEGWASKAEWCHRAAKFLARHAVKTVKKLPENVVRELADGAELAWRKKPRAGR